MMNMQEILTQLNIPQLLESENLQNESYIDVYLLNGKCNVPRKNILYIGKTSCLTEVYCRQPNIGFILIDDCNFDFSSICAEYVKLSAQADLFEIAHQINDLFYQHRRLAESSLALMNAFNRGSDLKEIIKIGGELLGNPVGVADSSFKMLALSTDEPINDPLWQDIVENGQFTYDYVMLFKKELKKSYSSNKPIYIDTGIGKTIHRVVERIVLKNNIAGIICALEYWKEFTEEDFKILSMLCGVISAVMNKDKIYNNLTSVIRNNLICDLLDGKITERFTLEEYQKVADWRAEGRFEIIVFSFNRNSANRNLYDYFIRYLNDSLYLSRVLSYEDYVLILCNFTKAEQKEIVERDVLEFAKKNKLSLGISLEFTDIMNINKYYKQACSALNLGRMLKAKGPLHRYADYDIYDLLLLTNKIANLQDFCDSALDTLSTYDKLNGTEYYKTLYYYLENGQNMSVTAQKLFIHRNTMAHRIDKICEIANINVDKEFFKLLLSYKIQEILKSKI